jgi:hypothetical protein
MKSQTRAWSVALILLLTWSTLFSAPFRAFYSMTESIAGWFSETAGLDAVASVWLSIVLQILVLSLMFWMGQGRRQRFYLAGYAALAPLLFHLGNCLRNRAVLDVPMPITIGVALALLFHLIPAKSPALWLADAFALSIVVGLVVDVFLASLFRVLDWPLRLLAPVLIIPGTSEAFALGGWLGIPLLVWTMLILILTLLPPLFLAGGRSKG